jgi:cell division protein FtsL
MPVKERFVVGIVALAVVISALSVIYTTHRSRSLFSELQKLQGTRDQLDVEWGQLQLEQSAWSNNSRIESIARDKLDMIVPTPDKMVIVKP